MPTGVSAWTPLANITLSASATTVTFSSITQTYRDLFLVVKGTSTTSAAFRLNYNNDATGTNYSYVFMNSTGGSWSTSAGSSNEFGSFYTGQGNVLINIMDYSTTDKRKVALSRTDNAANILRAIATRWANTSAITQIACTLNTGSFNSGTSFALYGVSA